MQLYLAGPLFSTAEVQFNTELADTLRRSGYDVFLPQEHEQNPDRPSEIFASDVAGIDSSDIVIACLDGADPDSGTCWELGYAFGAGKESIGYRTDIRMFEGPDKVNLMMTESVSYMIYLNQPSVDLLARSIIDRLKRL